MKKILYLSVLLCAVITSCSQREEIDMQKTPPTKIPQKEVINEDYDQIDVNAYISDNKDLFGNPLIFNSLDDADALLDSLQSMNSQELGRWIANNDFHNPIIESNYRYLLIYERKQAEFASAAYFASETDKLNAIISAIADEMESNYPTLCVISEYTTVDNHIVKSVRPLGDFDIYALCNEQGIVIADKIVYWLVGDDLISCPIDKFVSLASQSNVYNIAEDPNLSESEDYVVAHNVIGDISFSNKAQSVDDHNRYYVASNGDYKLTIYITAYPYWGWGSTNYRSKTTVKNLHNGSEYKTTTSGNFYYSALGQYGDLRANLYFYAYKSTDIKAEFKSKTYRENILMDQYTKTTETYVDIQRVYVNITQNTGAWDGMNKILVTLKVNE